MSIDVGFSAAPVFNEQDRLLMNTYISAVENMFTIRSNFLQQLLDPRRDIDQECGYPQSMTGSGFGSINPDLYRVLYEREGIACRVVQLYPNACWQKSPMVFETEDPEVVTPFEEAWDGISKQLRGEICHYQDEEGSPVWNYLHRADTLSGIGTFGVILLGVDDGKNLDQPLDGVASYDPTGNVEMTHEWMWNSIKVTKRVGIVNAEGQVVGDREQVIGVKRTFNGIRTSVFPTSPRAEPNPSCNRLEVDYYPVYENGTDGLPRQIGFKEHEYKGQVNNEASPTNNGVRVVNELPALFKETNLEADSQRPGFEASSGPKNAQGTGLLSSGQVGTDAQYVGIQLSPSEYPSDKASTEQRRLLFVRCYDESLVQIVQYEANVRNPRFGQPVMYRITLNDPREQHSGIGLPMATVRVHWSRIIHVSDNNGSSEVFGVPRMRPNLNRILDLRKIYASSAEGYWQQAFAKLVLSTHPQLGGDVKVNVPQLQNMLENVRNGLQREMLLMGMAASTVAPSVTDPTPHITVHIEAIAIQIGCPVRVLKGSERGELASSQDDDEWLDHVRFRQHNQCTPKIVVPFVDRLIACGVLPAPGQGSKTPTGKKVPAGKGWSKEGNGKQSSVSQDRYSDRSEPHDQSQKSPSSDDDEADATGMKDTPVIGNRRMAWNKVLEKWELVDNAFSPDQQRDEHGRWIAALQSAVPEMKFSKTAGPRAEKVITLKNGKKYKEPGDSRHTVILSTEKSPVTGVPVTIPGHESATGVALRVDPGQKHVHIDEMNSHIKGAGTKIVDAMVKAFPGHTFSAVDWSKSGKGTGESFWDKMSQRHPGKFVNNELVDNAFPPSASPNASQPKPPTPPTPPNGASKPPGGPPQAGGAPAPKPPKVTVPDTGKPQGYSVEWPDLDSLGDKDKAAIALQIVQAIQAYIAGGCEAVLPVFDFFVQVLGWDEELVTPILLKVQSQAEPTMSIPPPGELGHPATAEPDPKPMMIGPDGKPIGPAQDDENDSKLGNGKNNPAKVSGKSSSSQESDEE